MLFIKKDRELSFSSLYVPDVPDFLQHLKHIVIFHISIYLLEIPSPAPTSFILTNNTLYNLDPEHISNVTSYHSPAHSLYAKDSSLCLFLFHLLIPSSVCILQCLCTSCSLFLDCFYITTQFQVTSICLLSVSPNRM